MKEYNVKDSWIKDFLTVAYLPISLNQTAGPSTVLKAMEEVNRKQGAVQVVRTLKNGEILLRYMNGALVLYNPEKEEFKDLLILGLPKWFCIIVHVENLLPFQRIQRNEVYVVNANLLIGPLLFNQLLSSNSFGQHLALISKCMELHEYLKQLTLTL